MDLTYGVSTYDREQGGLPSLPVINMIAEQTPTEQGPILQSRPGLETLPISLNGGPVKDLYQIDGVLGGVRFAISGSAFFANDLLIGPINGDGSAKIAGFENLVFATQGQSLYQYDGATLSTVTTPDDFEVLDLCVGASRLVVIKRDTGTFYWSDALTSNIDALSFATAENSPDHLKACIFIGDTLYLFGSKTVELWPVSSDPTIPFAPLIGRTYQAGIRDTGCVTELNSTFAWITDNNQICLTNPNQIISLPDLEAKLSKSATASLWTFFIQGMEFLAVRLDEDTFVYSVRAGTWSKFESYGKNNFIPRCFCNDVFGSGIDGDLIQWSSNYKDFNGPMERRLRAGSVIKEKNLTLNNLTLRTNPGQTTDYTANSLVEVRTSADGGFTWSPWRQRSLGLTGKFRALIQWLGLGMFSRPGLLVEFRVTDDVDFRVSGVTANDGYGGI